jgi:hypothetical protein
MRQPRMVLHCAGLVLWGVLGCKHQPELKPPEQPEILASPSDKDKRFEMPCSYPADTLASDPNKKQDTGLMPASSKGKGGGMGLNGPGMGGGMPPGN